jgi:hypothetical protein
MPSEYRTFFSFHRKFLLYFVLLSIFGGDVWCDFSLFGAQRYWNYLKTVIEILKYY